MAATTSATPHTGMVNILLYLLPHRAAACIACFAIVFLHSWWVRAETRYGIGASIGRTSGIVKLDQRITLDDDHVEKFGPKITLWLYADRARQTPPSFDEFSAERIFPGKIDHGGYDELVATVDGCPGELAIPPVPAAHPVRGRDVTIAVCASATRPLTLHVRGTLRTAHRYGTLGHAAGTLMLGDPWYPLVVDGADSPHEATHDVDVRFDDGVLVGAEGTYAGGHASFTQEHATHAPLFLTSGSEIMREARSGVSMTFVTDREPRMRDAPATPEGFLTNDPWDIDAASGIVRATTTAVGFLRRLRFTASDVPRARGIARSLVVVQIPERERLAVKLPGMVAVSDRAFLVLPLDRVQRFHAEAIARRVFAALLDPHLRATETEADRTLFGDLDGSMFVDLANESERTRRDTPKDLVGFAGFHPAVDQLLYAPHVPFRSAYFHDIDESDPDRDGADRARNTLPFGQLVLEKLRDRLGPKRFASVAEAHLFGGASWRSAADPSFFTTWLGDHRPLSYGIVSHEDIALPGRPRYRHVVVVERRGALHVQEPVVVEMTDDDGVQARRVWDAPGERGTVTWDSDAPLDDAVLDPDRRLTEDIGLEPNHPRFDDEIAHAWRPPIFKSFALSVSVTEKRPDIILSFVVKRLYDVRVAYGVTAASTARGLSSSLRYFRGWGPLRDANSAFGDFSIGATALRSQNGFGGSPIPVSELDLVVGAGWDTRKQLQDPKSGLGVSALASVGFAREDKAAPSSTFDRGIEARGGDSRPTASIAVRGEKLFWPHPLHVIALIGGGGFTVCPALAQQQHTLSGRQLLRGYAADELIGCATTYAIVEERFKVLQGIYWNAVQISWFKGLELVPFVAGGLLSSRHTAADLFTNAHVEAGGGVRMFFEFGGIQPTLLAIDVGVPLSRKGDRYRDQNGDLRTRSPYGLYVSFEQTL